MFQFDGLFVSFLHNIPFLPSYLYCGIYKINNNNKLVIIINYNNKLI